MAGDWIKMRVWLRRDPRVASIADFLSTDRGFMSWLTDPVQRSCRDSTEEHVTSDVTRAITVCGLLEIWGVARDVGDRENDDLVMRHCDLFNLSDICGVPAIGAAMEFVGWAVEDSRIDAKGRSYQCVTFPNFFRENESPNDRYRRQHAEAQARYRAKNSDNKVTVTRDVTVTLEKRREENKEKHRPPAVREVRIPEAPPGFAAFWTAYPATARRVAKSKCLEVWKRDRLEERADAIVAHVRTMAASQQWRDGYEPAPLVYLNQKRYDDELPAVAAVAAVKGPKLW
jgi:hypothetical protein